MSISNERLSIMEKTDSQDVKDLVHEVEALRAKIAKIHEECVDLAHSDRATLFMAGYPDKPPNPYQSPYDYGRCRWFEGHITALGYIRGLIEEPE
jgi:hypothetical protein